jgi:hypothetical protein
VSAVSKPITSYSIAHGPAYAHQSSYQHKLRWLKRWIWVYFWLLIFEGALRKWALPSLSGPLLIIRDPVAMVIYFQANRCRKFSMNAMWPFAVLAVLMILLAGAQLISGIVTLPIALFGLRSYLLHLPLIAVMATTLEEEDLRKFGRWLLLLSIPMMFLILVQFKSPGGAWINAGAGEDSAQIGSAGNHIRAAGTFSYGNGAQLFVVLAAAFVLDATIRRSRDYPRWLIFAALFATIASVPLLGSRTELFLMTALGAFTLFSAMTNRAQLNNVLKIAAAVLLATFIVIQLPFVREGISVMSERWQNAASAEGDVNEVLYTRIFRGLEESVENAGTTPMLGMGIGMGSNFGAIQSTGTATFTLGEGEWDRVVNEFGPILGFLFIGMRFAFAAYLALRAKSALDRHSPLAWLLLPLALMLATMAVMEQATSLGFLVFCSGLCLAAARAGGSPTVTSTVTA